jgi:mRNA interferase MazF
MEDDAYKKEYKIWGNYADLLNSTDFEGFFYEREVWWCVLGVNIGSEQDGTGENFERPVLIIKKIRKDLAFIAPLTTKISDYPNRINTSCTGVNSQILMDQIRVVSSKRFMRKIAFLKKSTFQEVLLDFVRLILKQ